MDNVAIIRSIVFISVLLICIILQWASPSRPFYKGRWKSDASNGGIVLFNNVIIGFLPLIPYQMALIAADNDWGILNLNYFNKLEPVTFVLGILIMDMIIYFQHRMFHKVSFLWKLHSMHHIEPMLDVTSGLRFHPIEIVISNFIKVGTIILMGIDPVAVIVFEIALNGLAMFNHSNVKINDNIEKGLNKILITPALHTIHHSKIYKETNSNYGFSVPWWDKMFKTFKANGKYEQKDIRIGTVPMPVEKYQYFPMMLIQPFIKKD